MELMAGADASSGSLVPILGQAVKEDCEANTRRGGQLVGSRFSQQVCLACVCMLCVLMCVFVFMCVFVCVRVCVCVCVK